MGAQEEVRDAPHQREDCTPYSHQPPPPGEYPPPSRLHGRENPPPSYPPLPQSPLPPSQVISLPVSEILTINMRTRFKELQLISYKRYLECTLVQWRLSIYEYLSLVHTGSWGYLFHDIPSISVDTKILFHYFMIKLMKVGEFYTIYRKGILKEFNFFAKPKFFFS